MTGIRPYSVCRVMQKRRRVKDMLTVPLHLLIRSRKIEQYVAFKGVLLCLGLRAKSFH